MLNCRMGWHQILCLICLHFFLHSSLRFALPFCPLDQRDALLHFKNSFVLDSKASDPCHWHFADSYYQKINPVKSYPKTNSWYKGMDCCSWDGVACDDATGNIIGLDLTCSWLRGTLHSNSSLFRLRHLRSLNLFGNNFVGSHISSNLSAFATLTHLNLSCSSFSGSIPSEISRLSKLVSLDLSDNYLFNEISLEYSIFTMIVQNLTTLRKLVLDAVDMSMISPKSFANLSSSLTYLSVGSCSLGGIFPDVVFRLPSLTSLYIGENYNLSGILPKSIWTSPLETLSLYGTSFSGDIPDSIGNMKNLTILDLENCKFTGHIPSSMLNLNQLQVLWIDGNSFTGVVEFELFAKLKNLRKLFVSQELNLIYDTLEYTFPKLEVLSLISCNLTKFPFFLNSLKRLTLLDLSSNEISGEIPMWFWGISHDTLERLDLSNNLLEGGIQPSKVFTGEIPSSICQFSSLRYLLLSNNNFSGNMPSCFGNITNLNNLDLSNNKLQGPLPRSLVKCVNLSTLDLGHNEFNDIFPHWLEASQLYNLDLRSNKFYGRINLTVFELSFLALEILVISNNSFTGRWPIQFFSNTSLRVIDLSNNKFGGPILLPSPVTYYYSIASNNITGKIPSLICNATQLEIIDLSNNSLMGSLPWCLRNFSTDMSILNLRMNQLEGTIPQFCPSRSGLLTLDLSRNRFEGTLPQSLVKCRYLEVLDLSHNQIEDTFPRWLGTLPDLKVLVLRSNNLKGFLNIPTGGHLFLKLHILDLSNNNFSGPLPTNLIMNRKAIMDDKNGQDKSFNMTQSFSLESYQNLVTIVMKGLEIELERILTFFTAIDLSNNNFEGPLVIPPPGTLFYSIANNKVSGKISPLICNVTMLRVLNLSNNSLMGTLPECLMSFNKDLLVLNLRMNMIQGVIPEKFVADSNLRTLDLSQNQLEGTLPRSLRHCENMEVLDLSNNRIKDMFPNWLGTLPKLQVLVLRSNMFHGFVSSLGAAHPFSELRILDLSKNNLSGLLPIRYAMKLTAMMNQDEGRGKLQYMGGYGYQDSITLTIKGLQMQLVKILTVFTSIDLSSNHFGGELPTDIGNLKSLKGINFSHNNLTGYIPPSIGNLINLEWLDLSSNKLIGRIPGELANLTFLGFLNLSENGLVGPIPQGRQFNTFKSDSFVENPKLCGVPLPETCANNSREIPSVTILRENDTKHGGWFEWRAILMGYGCGIVVGLSLGYILLETTRKLEWLVGLFGRKGAKMRTRSKRQNRRSYGR